MKNNDGFTLIELIVIISIISILGVALMIRTPSTTPFELSGTHDTFIQDIRLAQILSMSLNARYRIVTQSNSYQILDANLTPYFNAAANASTVNFPEGITLTPATTIIFDALGSPYNATNTPLTNSLTFTLTGGTDTRTITLTPETGFVQ
jgi:prepilin-type N-terminal cleavage/methylation domain-containing protein